MLSRRKDCNHKIYHSLATDACESTVRPSLRYCQKTRVGGVVVELPHHASVDLQGGALEQHLMAGTIEEETGTGRDKRPS